MRGYPELRPDANVRGWLATIAHNRAIDQLRQTDLAALSQLGETLNSWNSEIAAMWRFSRNNGITEGFHNKMETISRQAYGFRNFENYRIRALLYAGKPNWRVLGSIVVR